MINFAIAGESDRYLNRDTFYEIMGDQLFDETTIKPGENRTQWLAQRAGRLLIRNGMEMPPARLAPIARSRRPMTLEELKGLDKDRLKQLRFQL